MPPHAAEDAERDGADEDAEREGLLVASCVCNLRMHSASAACASGGGLLASLPRAGARYYERFLVLRR